ncbi:DUF3017 domain-containing protein [Nocardioides sp. TRM66260-LWL]|uniref:DUF3017 domain-containing protein n=1 Tax=Nocardioides sp. TRM66260-LWL TaxID=2874478 RepID=UPI001CC733FA|nr:DUF3017 domain-containing protein [Nocardioides sp. TRM66260-LWL]MBZ5733238.1 DUF3017 domain-containing protein [Nocardioides sp. TRM66260-LWL]
MAASAGGSPEPDRSPRGSEDGRRWTPRTVGGWVYLGVLVIDAVGLLLALAGAWRVGVAVLGASLLLAAVARLLLRGRDAGMLAVRHWAIDAALLAITGGVVLALAATVPGR